MIAVGHCRQQLAAHASNANAAGCKTGHGVLNLCSAAAEAMHELLIGTQVRTAMISIFRQVQQRAKCSRISAQLCLLPSCRQAPYTVLLCWAKLPHVRMTNPKQAGHSKAGFWHQSAGLLLLPAAECMLVITVA